ncbi:O-antigen ligase family protein [Pseudoteredinibacter isoporae]|uniref:O-antigen ligase-related domain-containing protein n=1 Tax=Pseudoteredinibacter isoporae TaxID=570281 RepID=A0A7X0MXA4_9GAMM|nr:O-antigen ligase family protein [Pseudoteredinibacter isoporae]MBB6523065.1 hypothetical protein [Pseudoteredinibacter isoporae]NHO88585.1 O-antigen ligase family protein [Pseudoteredinibacter isoporae]NIB22724.1 O-antigen ligase family protein [Pseudoteredinibacter isoporae]
MATTSHHPLLIEERVIVLALLATWPAYLGGLLYVLGSMIAWLLLGLVLLRSLIEGNVVFYRTSPLSLLWIFAMAIMLLCLWYAHIDWELGAGKTIKSSFGWAKGWALFALFIFLGSILPLNLSRISRACCWVASMGAAYAFISIVAYALSLPQSLFISPLQFMGGGGPEFFDVRLYGINPETGWPRWFFYAPWAPAAGLVASLLLMICAREHNLIIRSIGIASCTLMIILCQSRVAWLLLLLIFPVYFFARLTAQRWIYVLMGALVPVFILFSVEIFEILNTTMDNIKNSRPDSTRVRAELAQIALQSWESDAYLFGHGIVIAGPKSVEFMPIGSHHSWYGLLYVKGLVGLLAFATPLILSLLYLFWRANAHPDIATGFALVVILCVYSFTENLEILAYLIWPALLWIGASLNPRREFLSQITTVENQAVRNLRSKHTHSHSA